MQPMTAICSVPPPLRCSLSRRRRPRETAAPTAPFWGDNAGVNDGEVGALGRGDLPPAELRQPGGELLGVRLVHLAALRPDVVSHGGNDCSTLGGGTAGAAPLVSCFLS